MSDATRRSRAFAPATVANVACGFDVLGLALESPGDVVTAELTDEPGVSLASIEGDSGRLSREPGENTASVAARQLLERLSGGREIGIRLRLEKGLPLASGMGSSAASAVAAVVAVRDLLGLDVSRPELLAAVVEGERVVAGNGHPDNAAASLYGGFVLVRSANPIDVIPLRFPSGLSVSVLRPHLEMSTRDSRALLGETVSLQDAVRQWANVGALVAGLASGDLELVSRSLEDAVAEPRRSPRVPGFAAVKEAALRAGALGSSLSGSGPSIFALCHNLQTARIVSERMAEALAASTDLEADLYVSAVDPTGAKVLDERREA